MSETAEDRCGLCGGPKDALKSYNATKFGVKMQELRLCGRCDLTPDPAPRREQGVG